MATLEFKRVTIEQFKCFGKREFKLYPRTDVIGANGRGKTTLGMTLALPFTGKDLAGHSNPEIHPDDMPESEPHITISGDIDGKPIEIEMLQRDLRTKKDRAEDKPPRIANKYKINAVDKSAKAFGADLLERGIDISKYEQLTNPNWFNGLKEADKRKAVFGMVGNITDKDVAESIKDEVPDVLAKLENYRLDEIESMAKAQKKTSSERRDAIPEQIIGMEKTKIDLSDIPELKAKAQRLAAQIQIGKEEFNKVPSVTKESIHPQIVALRQKQRNLVADANSAIHDELRKAQRTFDEKNRQYDSIGFEIETITSRIKRKESDLSYQKEQLQKRLSEYEEKKNSMFPADKKICPTCGQILPQDTISDREIEWMANREVDLQRMEKEENNLARKIKSLESEVEFLKKEHADKTAERESLEKAVSKSKKAVDAAEKQPLEDGNGIPEYVECDKQIAELERQMEDIDRIEAERAAKLKNLDLLESELDDVRRELSKEGFNAHVDEQIAELKKELREVSQSYSSAESILYQVSLLNKRKNEMLTDAVNANFPEYIRFKLFDTLKNGELKDCCIPLIRNEFGEWKELGKSANTALEMRAKIAILDAFQRYNDMYLPIIIDGGECLDAENKQRIDVTGQLIFLSVKDNADLTVTEI